MANCPHCEYTGNQPGDVYCRSCGKQISRAPIKKATTKSSGGQDLPQSWLILLIIMEIAGAAFIFTGVWIVGLPIVIAAGYFAYTQGQGTPAGDIIPRVTILIAAASINMITIIPEYKTISLFGFVIGWIMIILSLPEEFKKGDFSGQQLGEGRVSKKLGARGSQIAIYVIAILSTIIWTIIVLMPADPRVILSYEAITVPLVIAGIVWKQPIKPGMKLVGTIICFIPLIWIGINFLLIAGGAFFGGIFDQIQNALAGTGVGISGTALDMILNPRLAVQAGLKPATTREVTETEGPPNVEFTVSGDSLPENGCYDSSTFQIIGRVKNTGGEFINDLRMRMTPKKPISFLGLELLPMQTVCQDLEFNTDCPDEWTINSIPTGVTVSKNCIVESVPTPTFFEAELTVAPTHSCFINITAETGFHSLTRLPVEFIESDYGRNKFEQKQLTQRIVPGTTSIGAVELSLGGFEQPILYYGAGSTVNKVTMITTVSESGNGEALTYESAYLYIPTSLLDNGQCASTSDNWECLSVGAGVTVTKDSEGVISNVAVDCNILDPEISDKQKDYCLGFNRFKDNGLIGEFTQISYDNSDRLLDNNYAICFYQNDISDSSLISTGTCTLKIGAVMIKELRKTLIIRGDVLYTYGVRGEATITVKDCEV